MLIGREVTIGGRNDDETSRPDDSQKFLADDRSFRPRDMLDDFQTERRVKALRFERYGMSPRDRYPRRSLSCRRIHIEPNGLKSPLPELNYIHTVATARAEDFSTLQPATL